MCVSMANKKETNYLVLENQSGGRAALEYWKEFSSAIPYRQVCTNGGLDFQKGSSNKLLRSELEKYKYKRCDTEVEAKRLVDEGFEIPIKGTCSIMD